MTSVLLIISFSFGKSSLVHRSLDGSGRLLFSCAWKYQNLPSFFLEWNEKPYSLLLHISKCWKNDQVYRSRLFRWEFSLRNWILCVSLFQIRNPPRNVDKNATLFSSSDPQHLPLCVPRPHILFLIWSAFRVECFYVDVNREILETLDKKVYTWRWHQVLRRCDS